MTKTCKECNVEFPKTKEFFYFSGNKCQTRCKQCHSKYTSAKIREFRAEEQKRIYSEKTMQD